MNFPWDIANAFLADKMQMKLNSCYIVGMSEVSGY